MASAQYETTLIVTPEKSDTEVSKLIKGYTKFLTSNGAELVHEESWGLRNLAYEINRKSTGFYYTLEYSAPTELIATFELNMKRDDSIMRFLTLKLDKYALDYNERKRKGLIGRDKDKDKEKEAATHEKSETAKKPAKTERPERAERPARAEKAEKPETAEE